MLIISIILIILCLVMPLILSLIEAKRCGYFDGVLLGLRYVVGAFGLIIPALLLSPLVQISFGEKTYTGYIYSSEDFLNRTVGHIRFSENAGEDTQPSFCVVKGSAEAEKIRALTGSGKKVKVKVPAGFALQMWYGECGLPAVVEEME